MRPTLPRLLLLALFGAVACPACLILDPVDFPPRTNSLPRITSTQPGALVLVDRTGLSQEFVVGVVDDDASDVLDARVFLDAHIFFPAIAVDQERDVRTVTVVFDASDFFPRGCHRVEIDVVDDRSGWIGERDVEEGVGRVTASWFVLANDGDGYDYLDIPLASCPVDEGSQSQ